MRGLLEQFGLLRDFLRGSFRRTLLWCALGLLLSAGLGFAIAKLEPDVVDQVLSFFTQMIQEAGVVDEAGTFSPFALLTNNWRAMLVSILYGFIPFLFLPAVTLLVNGALLGILAGWYHSQGISLALYLAGILPHGVLELPALVLSAACGVVLCRNMCKLVTSDPKRTPMVDLLSDLLRVLLLLIAPMVVAAAFIEAYLTPYVMELFL